jgi:protein-tyrosine-phosphatase
MKILYVCAAGGRRSVALAGYTNLLRGRYGMPEIEAEFAAGNQGEFDKQSDKQAELELWCETAEGGKYKEIVDKIRNSGVGETRRVHPRIAALLNEEGIDMSFQERKMVKELPLGEYGLILAVQPYLKTESQNITGDGRVFTVKEFLGFPPEEQGIDDVESWDEMSDTRKALGKMGRDRILVSELKSYSQQVIEKMTGQHDRVQGDH